MKRQLWQTVSDLVEALAIPEVPALNLYVTAATVDLPIELVIVQTKVGFQLLVDAPHFRWDAGLRPQTGRMRLVLEQVDPAETARFAQSES